MAEEVGYETYSLGDVALQKGGTLPDAKLAYKTYGTLNADKSNVIVCPIGCPGVHTDYTWFIGKDKALDPDVYFIIVPCLLGNGESSSPSNTPAPNHKSNFPNVTIYDNVTLQHRFITSHFGITNIKLVVGWSVGGIQTYQWGCLYPDMVERIAPLCGSAKTAPHNFVFLEGAKAALKNDAAWNGGMYDSNPEKAMRAVGRVWAGWAVSQPYYRQELWRKFGFESVEGFLVGFWEGFFCSKDANNLLALIWTWQNADISDNDTFNGDFAKALGAIKAKAVVMPGARDLYFPPEDNEEEVKLMPDAKVAVIPGVSGHMSAGGINGDDVEFIDGQLKELLTR